LPEHKEQAKADMLQAEKAIAALRRIEFVEVDEYGLYVQKDADKLYR
jgi:hypothetical protein